MGAHAYDYRQDFGMEPCPECGNTMCQCPVEEPPRVTGAELEGQTIGGITFIAGGTVDLTQLEPLHGPRPDFVRKADGTPANPFPSVVPDFRSIPVPMTPERGAMLWESLRSLVHILAHVPLASLSQSERVAIDIASARLTAGLERPAEPHSRYVPVHPETGAALV